MGMRVRGHSDHIRYPVMVAGVRITVSAPAVISLVALPGLLM